jgi:hypothetical protein
MKPYQELTQLGRLRRLCQLASVALDAYGLGGARFKLLRQAGNTLFRVLASNPTPATAAHDLCKEGQYLLRIHQPGYQATDAIELELAWLAAMCREAHLPVQEPIPALDGRLLIQVSIPGVPKERNCSLLRRVKGRYLKKDIRPYHYRAQGRLVAFRTVRPGRCCRPLAQSRSRSSPGECGRSWTSWAKGLTCTG